MQKDRRTDRELLFFLNGEKTAPRTAPASARSRGGPRQSRLGAVASFLRVDVVQTVRWEEEEVCAGERQIAARPWDRVHVKHSPSRAAL